MTLQELAEAKADLALARAALRRRLGGKDIVSVASTGENVAFAKATVAELREIIADLSAQVRLADPAGYGAIHIA